MDFVELHEAEDRADAGHGLQQIERVGVMVFGGLEDGEFDIAEQPIIVIADEREIDFDTLVHRGISTALGDAITVGLEAIFSPIAGR